MDSCSDYAGIDHTSAGSISDSSKYEKSALIKVADMSPHYLYITDSQLPDEVKEVYKNNDI